MHQKAQALDASACDAIVTAARRLHEANLRHDALAEELKRGLEAARGPEDVAALRGLIVQWGEALGAQRQQAALLEVVLARLGPAAPTPATPKRAAPAPSKPPAASPADGKASAWRRRFKW